MMQTPQKDRVMQVVYELIRNGYIGRKYAHSDMCVTTTDRILHLFLPINREEGEKVDFSFIARMRRRYLDKKYEFLEHLNNSLLNQGYEKICYASTGHRTPLFWIDDPKTEFTDDVNQTAKNLSEEFVKVSRPFEENILYPCGSIMSTYQVPFLDGT
ncbi:MAG: hypothetical protein NTW30_05405 [Candidatus Aenigmarchaeota archaeon]|nr:hypothetical protein [Candidatus Aenigmarchaeota archaeon]